MNSIASIDGLVEDYCPSKGQHEKKGLMQRVREYAKNKYISAASALVLAAGMMYGAINPRYANAEDEAHAATMPEFPPDLSGYKHLAELDKRVNSLKNDPDLETTARVYESSAGDHKIILLSLENETNGGKLSQVYKVIFIDNQNKLIKSMIDPDGSRVNIVYNTDPYKQVNIFTDRYGYPPRKGSSATASVE